MSEDTSGISSPAASGDSLLPSPDLLLHLAFGFAPPLMVRSAVQLGLFDALAAAPLTAPALAAALDASIRGVTPLCEALAAFGLLARDAQGRFGLTSLSSAYLLTSKPEQNLGALFVQAGSQLIPSWLELTQCVRSGRPHTAVNRPHDGAPLFGDMVEGLLPMNWAAACQLADHVMGEGPCARALKILDVAAGSGVWSLPFARKSPGARVTAVDWPDVLPVTRRVCERYGLADRYRFSAGDLGEADLGRHHDWALLGHILHSEGEASSRRLLARVCAALAPGGGVAIAEFLSEEDRSGPMPALVFALNMLVHSEAGSTFSFGQIAEWLREAGFVDVRRLEVSAPSPLILATKPPSQVNIMMAWNL